MNFAEYEGNWEEHTIENEYSVDCSYEEADYDFNKGSAKLYIVFDIDDRTGHAAHVSWGKKIKIDKKSGNVID